MSSAKQYDIMAELRQQLADALRDVEAANYLRDKHREESVQLRAQVAKLERELAAAREGASGAEDELECMQEAEGGN